VNRQKRHTLPLSIVVAMTTDRVIGKRGKLPWRLPQELALFRQITLGGTLIMGRKTFNSIGRPLAQRRMIVLSSSTEQINGIERCADLGGALRRARELARPVFVVGGAQLYKAALPLATQLHISWIEGDFRGETLFPEFDEREWLLEETRAFDGFCYCRYERTVSPESATEPARGGEAGWG
jgi:dihydrofolate reductase